MSTRLVTILVIAALAIAAIAAMFLPRTLTGQITCPEDQQVVGVWMAVPLRNGWAEREPHLDRPEAASYRFTGSWLSLLLGYQVHVGCGGTPGNWQHNDRAKGLRLAQQSLVCASLPDRKYGECQSK